MRFSLKWLFGMVAFAAVACLTLVYATEALNCLLGWALYAFLVATVLGTIFSNRIRRPFWAGCAIVGWFYAATAYLPPRFQTPWLATNAALDRLHPIIARTEKIDPPNGRPTYGGTFYFVQFPQREPFNSAGQALATFVWSIAGGMIAGYFYSKSARDKT